MLVTSPPTTTWLKVEVQQPEPLYKYQSDEYIL